MTSAERRHPASSIILSLNRARSYQGRSWRELEVWGAICLPVEGNLVYDRDLKAGDLRLAVFLAEPNHIGGGKGKFKKSTCKEVFGQSVRQLLACGNPC